MKRLIDHYLKAWKQDPKHKALLIRGARQVGKTYSIRTLGACFEELVEINLEMNPECLNLSALCLLHRLSQTNASWGMDHMGHQPSAALLMRGWSF